MTYKKLIIILIILLSTLLFANGLKAKDLVRKEITIVVDKYGTGRHFKSVQEGVNYASRFTGSTKITIYVKEGVYEEHVEVNQNNIAMIGDGKGLTVISGNRSVETKYKTFDTATVAVNGDGFIAQSITFRNTAGPQNHQAVALRLDSKYATIYNCSIEGYQDTLYVHSGIQFFRDCDVSGTVDFIFGDAATVLQNCNLYARNPMPGQIDVVTAPTGIVIQDCKIMPSPGVSDQNWLTYLGRPWKAYSRVVIMETFIDKFVPRQGWLAMNGSIGLNTLYYAEYQNNGPGSTKDGSGRVKWKGYNYLTFEEASRFTVSNFIKGNEWLPSTNVPFKAGL